MICLTFDTDHMSHAHLLRWFESSDIHGHGTFFCTEYYAFLEKYKHEVGPHPDLGSAKDWKAEIERFRALFPDATSWRSHSLYFSQTVNVELQRAGYKALSVVEQFLDPAPRPYRLPWGLTQFPIYYMDNSDFCNFNDMHDASHVPFAREIIDQAMSGEGVYVFDFHPIHLELNTPSYEFYAAHRDRLKGGEAPKTLAFQGYGTRSFFEDLNAAMRKHGRPSVPLRDLSGRA